MDEKQSSRSNNNKIVHANNKKMLLMLIKEMEPVAINTLMTKSTLSYPTIYAILKELVNEGFIEKQGYAPTTGGRQAGLYAISGISRYTIGIHIYYNTLSATVCTIKGGRVYDSGVKDCFWDSDESKLRENILSLLDRVGIDTRIPSDHIIGICLSAPIGRIILNSVVSPPIIVRTAILAKTIQEASGIPTIGVADREVLNHHEQTNYRIAHLKEYLFLLFEKELGLTIYSDRFNKTAINDTGGAFGHTTVVPGGAVCVCGKNGCLESYCNGEGLFNLYKTHREAHSQPCLSAQEFRIKKDLFHEMLELCHHRDAAALAAIDTALQMLGIALANVIKAAGIGTIIISGLFTSSDYEYKLRLEQFIRENVPEDVAASPGILIGTALPQDCAYAACLMLNKFYMEKVDFQTERVERKAL